MKTNLWVLLSLASAITAFSPASFAGIEHDREGPQTPPRRSVESTEKAPASSEEEKRSISSTDSSAQTQQVLESQKVEEQPAESQNKASAKADNDDERPRRPVFHHTGKLGL